MDWFKEKGGNLFISVKFRGRIWLKAWLDSPAQILSRVCLSFLCFPQLTPSLISVFLCVDLMVVEMVTRVTSYQFRNPHGKKMSFLTAVENVPGGLCLPPAWVTVYSQPSHWWREGMYPCRPILRLCVHLMAEDKVSSTLLHGLN